MGVVAEFKTFALRGNVVDLAIGFTVGAAFTTIAKSLVSDMIMPAIGLVLGQADFSDLFAVLKEGAKAPGPYETLAQARATGAITINYGVFINNVVAFLMVALAMFVLVRIVSRLDAMLEQELRGKKLQPGEPSEKKCRYCLTTIHFRAVRCPACTSELDRPGELAEPPAP